jgi:4-amino-4-deoxy-L-arabinose transferase-like glycosyltransferase
MKELQVFHWIRKHPLAALIGVATAVKALLFFVLLPELSGLIGGSYGIGFADKYDDLARSLFQGTGYRFAADKAPTMMREPGYPLFLSTVFHIFGDGIVGARISNLLLSVGIALLLARLARRFTSSESVVVITVAITLFHPGFVIAEARGGVEIFFIFFLLVFILMLYRASDSASIRDFFLAGLVLGLVVMIRSTPLLFPVVIAVILVFTAESWSERVRSVGKVAVMIVAMLVVMTPWITRNYLLVEQFVPTSSVQGVAAQTGQYICENLSLDTGFRQLDNAAANERVELGKQEGLQFSGSYYQLFYEPGDELKFSKLLMSRVTQKYRDQPLLYVKCVSTNLFNFWFAGKTWTVTGTNILVQLPLLGLSLIGVFVLWRERKLADYAVIGLFVLYVYSLHVAVHSQARYSIPLVPFLAIPAGAALMNFWRVYKGRAPGGELAHKG